MKKIIKNKFNSRKWRYFGISLRHYLDFYLSSLFIVYFYFILSQNILLAIEEIFTRLMLKGLAVSTRPRLLTIVMSPK